MRNFLFLLISFLMVLPLQAKTKIEVLSSSEVSDSPVVTLGMISNIHRIPELEQHKISKVVLGNAPKLGEKIVFTSTAIALAFRKHFSKNELSKYQLIIPRQVTINLKNRSLNSKNVNRELMSIWSQSCSDCEYKIKHLVVPRLNSNSMVEHWSLDVGREVPKGSFNLPIHIKIKNQGLKQYWVSGQVKTYKKVLVAKRALQIGERLSEDKVTYAVKDITYSYDTAAQMSEIKGRRLRQGKRAGAVIWNNSISREKALVRGDIVKLYIGGEKFEISTMGKAQNDAYLGDRVQVKTLGTGKMLTGSVIKKGEVKVE